MISRPFDIFRKENGAPIWVEAVENVDRAKRRIIELSARTPGQYMVFSQNNGQVVSTVTTVASPAAREEHRNDGDSLEDFGDPSRSPSDFDTVF